MHQKDQKQALSRAHFFESAKSLSLSQKKIKNAPMASQMVTPSPPWQHLATSLEKALHHIKPTAPMPHAQRAGPGIEITVGLGEQPLGLKAEQVG
jgi:hypothetical protein